MLCGDGRSDLRGHPAAGNFHHVLARDHLDALALDAVRTGVGAGLLAEGPLVRVQGQPAFPAGVLHAAVFQEFDDRLRRGRRCQRQVFAVLQQVGHGFQGVALGVADQADRAALDPAGGVDARHVGAGSVQDAAAVVRDNALAVVELDLGQRGAEVADGAVDGLDRVVDELAGAAGVPRAVQLRALELDPGDAAGGLGVVVHLDRAVQEVQVQAAGSRELGEVLGLLGDPVGERAHHGLGLVVALDLPVRFGVELEVLGVEDDVHVLGVGQLAQLQRGELHLGGAAAAEDVHVGDRGVLQAAVDVVRDFGDQEVIGVLGEHPGDVEGDVAVADHGDFLGIQRPVAGNVRVAVVPGDEVGAAVGALEFDARDVQVRVLDGAGGEDDGVVVRAEVLEREVRAVVDVAEEADVAAVQDLVQGVDDALDARVVGGHAVADQAVGRRVAVEEVDADGELAALDGFALGQDVRGVHTGGSGADDGDAQRAGGSSYRGVR